jgi:hypothetical protein
MTDHDPQRNVGENKLEADPGAGRGGSREDAIPEQMEKEQKLAQESPGSRPVDPQAWQGEPQEVRGEKAEKAPGHVGSPEQLSEASQGENAERPGAKPQR